MIYIFYKCHQIIATVTIAINALIVLTQLLVSNVIIALIVDNVVFVFIVNLLTNV